MYFNSRILLSLKVKIYAWLSTITYVYKMKEMCCLPRESVASKNILDLINTPFFFLIIWIRKSITFQMNSAPTWCVFKAYRNRKFNTLKSTKKLLKHKQKG